MLLNVYNNKIEKVEDIDVPDNILNKKFNSVLVHQVYASMRSNERVNIAHCKGRGEVRGGGKKPWAQKHTGRARHGSIRSPIWKGGGVTGGPTKNKSYKKKINNKMKKEALISVFSKRINDGEVFVFDNFKLESPKTSIIFKIIKNFGKKILKKDNFSKMLVWDGKNDNLKKSISNLLRTKGVLIDNINVKDILDSKYIFITKNAFNKFLEKFT